MSSTMAPYFRLAALLPSRAGALQSLVIAAFLCICMWMGVAHVPLSLSVFVFATMLVVTKCGELSAKPLLPCAPNASTPLHFLLGFAITLLGMTVLVLAANISPGAALGLLIAAVGVWSLFTDRASPKLTSSVNTDLLVVAVVAIVICCLGRAALSAPLSLQTDGVLTTWVDYYLHGETISSFGSRFALGGDIEVAFASRPLYHYASFLLPAALQEVTDLSGLALATSFLLPMGLLIAAMGCYALAVEVGGRITAVIAIMILIFAPIPSSYLLHCGWYDFYWLLFISPGTGYGLGLACAASALVVTYTRTRNVGLLLACAVVIASLAVTRVQFFMLAAPIATFLAFSSWKPKLAKMALVFALAASFIGVVCCSYSQECRQEWESFSRTTEYLDFALKWSTKAPLILKSVSPLGFARSLSLKLGLILLSILGAFAVLYPVLLILYGRKFGLRAVDAFPIVAIGIYTSLLLLTPAPPHGDLSEYKHRHFGLLYVYTIIFTCHYSARLLGGLENLLLQNKRIMLGIVSAGVLGGVLFYWGTDPGKADEISMPWVKDLQYRQLLPGLYEAAEYIRKNSEPGDIFTTGPATAAIFNPGSPAAEIIALSGVPSFLTRSALKVTGSECMQALSSDRLEALQKILHMDDSRQAFELAQRMHIRWFVALPGESVRWDSNRGAASFSTAGVSVYDMGRSAAPLPTKMACS